jgi:apolipoprotein N-acyltransferase
MKLLGGIQRSKWWPFATAFIVGAFSALAFAPVNAWPLMLFAFAILLGLLRRAGTLKRALLIGWLFGLGQFVIGLNWIATAFTFQAAMPAWLGWIAVVLLSLYLAVYPMLAAGVAWRIGRGHPLAMAVALAGAWAITEWLRAGIFTGFAWNPVGVILVPTPLLKLSSLVGTYGMSALVVLLSAAVWLETFKRWLSVAIIVGATVLLWLLPLSSVPETNLVIKPIRVVQPDIGQQDKWRPGYSDIAAERLARLSNLPGGAHPRLLFWPEAAVTEPMQDQRRPPYSAFAEFERRRAAASIGPGEYLLTGGIGLTSPDGMRITGGTNSIYVLGQGGRIVARYDKAHLVPYGEYLPMRPLLSALGLSRLAPGDVDFIPGPGPRTLALPNWGRVGFQLCYEIIFSGEVVDRHNRPDFIFNPSNDAWFGAWGPPQHLAQARLRAAEEGLPVIRSTPTGISAVIDATGQVRNYVRWKATGVIDAAIPPSATRLTTFARLGNVIPLTMGFALLILAIVLEKRGRYRTGI